MVRDRFHTVIVLNDMPVIFLANLLRVIHFDVAIYERRKGIRAVLAMPITSLMYAFDGLASGLVYARDVTV